MTAPDTAIAREAAPRPKAPAKHTLLSVGVQLTGVAAAIVLLLALLGGAVVAVRLVRSHMPVEAGLAAVPKSDLVGIGLAEVLARIVVLAGPVVIGFLLGMGFARVRKRRLPQHGLRTRTEARMEAWLSAAVPAFVIVGVLGSTPFMLGSLVEYAAALVAFFSTADLLVAWSLRRPQVSFWGSRRLGGAVVVTALLVAAIAPEIDLPPRFDRIAITANARIRLSGLLVADTGSTYYVGVDGTLQPIAHSSAGSVVISDPAKPSESSQRSLLQRLFGQ